MYFASARPIIYLIAFILFSLGFKFHDDIAEKLLS